MSAYAKLCESLLFPMHEKLKRHDSVTVRRSSNRRNGGRIEAVAGVLQLERLRAFLVEAGRTVPYYRALFEKSGFDPDRMNAIADLQQLPFLDKPTIRAQGDQLTSERAGPLVKYNTGGSSGEPLVFVHGDGARFTRRRRKMASDAMVGCGHRRHRDRPMGFARGAGQAGSRESVAGRRVPQPPAAGVPDVRNADGPLPRPYLAFEAINVVRLRIGTCVAGRSCRGTRPRHESDRRKSGFLHR